MLFRTEKRRNAEGVAYPWIVKTTGVVNHFYVYAVDAEFGPFFLKFCSSFPYHARLCINGHEWAQRQARKKGITFTALDNGFARVEDPAGLQALCAERGAGQIQALLDTWLAILPSAFTDADREAGYRYEVSVLQAEFSLTQVLDQPVSGACHVFRAHALRDNLDAGRPDRVSLVVDRQIRGRRPRATPGRFRTRVITQGVTPRVYLDYKHATIKQYHQHGRALRTETTINDTRDFGIGKRLTNLPALRQAGFTANRRLLGAQLSHNPIHAEQAFTAVHHPIITDTGERITGLRLGDHRAHALLQALVVFRLLPHGFRNPDLRSLLAQLPGNTPTEITPGQITDDLRRLPAHGLITRTPGTHRYTITHTGLHHAMLLTHPHTRLPHPGLAQLTDPNPPTPSPPRTTAHHYQHPLNHLTQEARLAT